MTEYLLLEIKQKVKETRRWPDIMLNAHNAFISMGLFQEPLEPELIGLPYGQWQHEKAKRIVLSVIDSLLSDNNGADGDSEPPRQLDNN